MDWRRRTNVRTFLRTLRSASLALGAGIPTHVAIAAAAGLVVLAAGFSGVRADESRFEAALRNGERANGALRVVHRTLAKWANRKHAGSALIRGGPNGDRWTVRGTAGGLYPQLALAAHLTQRDLLDGLLTETLRDEIRLTSRLMRLPDDYDLLEGRFLHDLIDGDRIVTSASEYAAQGLTTVTNVLGPGPWAERTQAIVDDLLARASIQTPFSEGLMLSGDAEVNGNLLCVLPLLAEWSGDPRYLEWARRIADVYCLGILPKNGGLPPLRWNFRADRPQDAELRLDGAGCSIITGLVLLYAVEAGGGSDRAPIYRPVLSNMWDVLLAQARNSEGYFYARIEPDGRGAYSVDRRNRSRHWADLLATCVLFGQASGNPAYVQPARDMLQALPQSYARTWGNRSDATAEAVPGILTLLARILETEPMPDATDLDRLRSWIDREVPKVLRAPPAGRGVDEEHRDAVLLRSALSYAWFRTAGMAIRPWNENVVYGATVTDDTLYVALRSDEEAWEGRLLFDTAPGGSPAACANSRGFPDWFAIDPDSYYRIEVQGAGGTATWSGSLLRHGLQVDLEPQEACTVRIVRLSDFPPVRESGPPDSTGTESPKGAD